MSYRLGDVIVLPAAMNAGTHYIPRRHTAGIEIITRESATNDVTIRHHADQLIILANGNGADIITTHQFREPGLTHFTPLCIAFDSLGEPPLLKLRAVFEIHCAVPA